MFCLCRHRAVSSFVWRHWWEPVLALVLLLLTVLGNTPAFAATEQRATPTRPQVTLPTPGREYCGYLTDYHCELMSTRVLNIDNVTVYFSQQWWNDVMLAYPIPGSFGPKGIHHRLTHMADFQVFCTSYRTLCNTMQTGQLTEISELVASTKSCTAALPNALVRGQNVLPNISPAVKVFISVTVLGVGIFVPAFLTGLVFGQGLSKAVISGTLAVIGGAIYTALSRWHTNNIDGNNGVGATGVAATAIGSVWTGISEWFLRTLVPNALHYGGGCLAATEQALGNLCTTAGQTGKALVDYIKNCYVGEPYTNEQNV